MPRIQIWESTSLGLVISCPTGIMVSNQVAGHACYHPEIEGVYLPLQVEADELERHFVGPKWQGWCMEGIDKESADFLDEFLLRNGNTKGIRVDRERLADSWEAWIHVRISAGTGDADSQQFSGFGEATGVLTWQNSD